MNTAVTFAIGAGISAAITFIWAAIVSWRLHHAHQINTVQLAVNQATRTQLTETTAQLATYREHADAHIECLWQQLDGGDQW